MHLPEKFLDRMRALLEEEFPAFLESYRQPRQYGLRVNCLKTTPEEFEAAAPFPVQRIPWVPDGFFYGEGIYPARHPYYAAGLYYLQEPSAMTPASRLPVEPGERVLDLCAAPGGKATEMAAKLKGEGLLVANDLSVSRARALLRNLELMGASNCFVTSETPARLAAAFPEYFHKILVDAPCSGEGMFRKDEDVAAAWSEEKVKACAAAQRQILESAAAMLKPGGMLLYSTCTFAPEEDEENAGWFLSRFPEFTLIPMEPWEGFSPGRPGWGGNRPELSGCIRIWPHRMQGEGHFLALFQKAPGEAGREPKTQKILRPDGEQSRLLGDFLKNGGVKLPRERVEVRGQRAFLVPELPETVRGLKFLRNGLYLGEFKKGRFEPSQPFAMWLNEKNWKECVSFHPEDPRTEQYLRGEAVPVEAAGSGWRLVCVDGFSLGWGKLSGGLLKNKYLCTWRKK